MGKATKEKKVVSDDPLAALGMGVKVKEKKSKKSDTPKIMVDAEAVCVAIKNWAKANKDKKDADQRMKSAQKVIMPLAQQTLQDKSRSEGTVHKSVHVYEKESMNGVTYKLGRFSPGDAVEPDSVSKAREALKEIFGSDFEKYFRVAVSLTVNEDECTAENIALLREKLGDEVFGRLFEASPALKINTTSDKDKLQLLMRDCIMEKDVIAKVGIAASKKLLKRGYDSLG